MTYCRYILPMLLIAVWGCSRTDLPVRGVVVSSCEPGWTAAVAGLQAGDLILEWHQGSAGGEASSPFLLAVVEQELAPYGPVDLRVRRGPKTFRIPIPLGQWKVSLRPAMDRGATADHLRARELMGAVDTDGAVRLWADLAEASLNRDLPSTTAWLHTQTGVALARIDRKKDAVAALADGASLIADPHLVAAYWERAGDALLKAGQTALAADAFSSAIAILEKESPSSPALANALVQLCRTDFRACSDEANRALEIFRETRERAIETAVALSITATVAYYRSDLEKAERDYRKALEIAHDTAPGGPTETNLFGGLGLVARKRGDFDTARSFFLRERASAEKLGVDTLEYAFASNYLGLIARSLGRFHEAQMHYEQALESFRASRPDGVEVAGMLTNLGGLWCNLEDFRKARTYLEDALRLRRRLDPEGTSVASSLNNVGTAARLQGDLNAARTHLEEAFELKQRLHPGSLWVATTSHELGELAREEGHFEAAARHHRAALEIRRQVAPHHPDVAVSLLQLGVVEFERDRTRSAETHWRHAVALVEAQRRRLDVSPEQRAHFKAKYRACYFRLADLLIDEGRPAEAWDLIEQARAVALRAAVAHRRGTPAGVEPALWHAKTRAETRLARIESRIVRMDPAGESAQLARYREQAATVEGELSAISRTIREAAPNLPEHETPEALPLSELRGALDPGTVVLAYAVGTEHTAVLVTGSAVDDGPEIRTFKIAVSEIDLRDRVERFNSLMARGRTETEIETAVSKQAQRLFELLVAPLWGAVEGAGRVLIIPDGPLHNLAFAALRLPGDDHEYFGLTKPLFINPSASLAVELSSGSRDRQGALKTVVAFGDPLYTMASSVVREHDLDPLPGSRTEIKAVQRTFGRRSEVFLGRAASEANLRAHAGDAEILHCAVHARVDALVAMDSSLFLSQVSESGDSANDGVLSAWEIAEELELDGATVVLSSCSTARGRVIPGEGIIGLARAFQIAGARSLVVSQWAVPDHSTAELMTAFYRRLNEGDSNVEALRNSQRIVASDPRFAHPYHWAAFQVRGDWH